MRCLRTDKAHKQEQECEQFVRGLETVYVEQLPWRLGGTLIVDFYHELFSWLLIWACSLLTQLYLNAVQ